MKKKKVLITDVIFSLWLIIDVDSILGLLHRVVVVGDFAYDLKAADTSKTSAKSHTTPRYNARIESTIVLILVTGTDQWY
jgi:hypothetical protein